MSLDVEGGMLLHLKHYSARIQRGLRRDVLDVLARALEP